MRRDDIILALGQQGTREKTLVAIFVFHSSIFARGTTSHFLATYTCPRLAHRVVTGHHARDSQARSYAATAILILSVRTTLMNSPRLAETSLTRDRG
eukprot:scaffold208924_cov30-Tisochrysis_lutea.AAC.4